MVRLRGNDDSPKHDDVLDYLFGHGFIHDAGIGLLLRRPRSSIQRRLHDDDEFRFIGNDRGHVGGLRLRNVIWWIWFRKLLWN